MKRIRKTLLCVLVLCCALSACILVGCKHKHTFSNEWSKDETYHWHEATCEHEEIADKAEHTFGTDNLCSVCGYETVHTKQLTFEAVDGGRMVTGIEEGAEIAGIVIPEYNEGEKVVAIGEMALAEKPWLKSVAIPASVTSIGEYAFYASGIEEIVIPDSVKTLEAGAFYQCPSLTKATLGDGITTIPNNAFRESPLLSEVTLGSSVTTVGEYAFYGTALEKIELSDSVIELKNGAFYNTQSLTEVKLGNGLKTLGDYVFYKTGIAELTLPAGIETVGKGVAYECASLASVTIDCAASFGASSFKNCAALATVTANATAVFDSDTFYGCSPMAVYINADDVVFGAKAFKNGNCDVIFGDGVTSVGANICRANAVKRVVFPKSLKKVGKGAFSDCIVERVDYAGTVSEWAAIEFENAANPVSVWNSSDDETPLYANGELVEGEIVIDGIERVGSQAFYGYTRVTKITLGESVRSAGSNAFGVYNVVNNLTAIIVLSKEFRAYSGFFGSNASLGSTVDTVILYKGTAKEMAENVVIWWSSSGEDDPESEGYHTTPCFGNKFIHYFYSEDPTAEEEVVPPIPSGSNLPAYTFGGWWHFDENGSPILWDTAKA